MEKSNFFLGWIEDPIELGDLDGSGFVLIREYSAASKQLQYLGSDFGVSQVTELLLKITQVFEDQQRGLGEDHFARGNLPGGEDTSSLPRDFSNLVGRTGGLVVTPVILLTSLVAVGNFATDTFLVLLRIQLTKSTRCHF